MSFGYRCLWTARYLANRERILHGLERWLERRQEARFQSLGLTRERGPVVLDVPRLELDFSSVSESRHSRGQLQEAMRLGRPVIVRGLSSTCAAYTRWSWNGLRDRYGSSLVRPGKHSEGEAIAVADVIDAIVDGKPTELVGNTDLFNAFPELTEDLALGVMKEILQRKIARWELFLSPAYTRTPYHAEITATLSLLVAGRKCWTLVDPEYAAACYPNVGLRRFAGGFHSFLHLEAPDVRIVQPRLAWIDGHTANAEGDPRADSYPLLPYPPKHVARLEAGDALFVPSWWWHDVVCDEPTIAVSLRLLPTPREIARHKLWAAYNLVSPSIWNKVWRAIRGGAEGLGQDFSSDEILRY